MWPFEFLEDLAIDKNICAQFKDVECSKSRSWNETNAGDSLIWIGLFVYMEILHQGDLTSELWAHTDEYPYHCIGRFHSQNQFEQIKRYRHIGGEGTYDLPRQKFFEKLDSFASELGANWESAITPSSYLSIGEIMMMILFTGRSSHTYLIRAKPIPVGYQRRALCDAGHCWTWIWDSTLFKAPSSPNQADV